MTEREILETRIKYYKAGIEAAEERLVEIDKPKEPDKPEEIKHLDYGFNMAGEPRVFLLKDGKIQGYSSDGRHRQHDANAEANEKYDDYYVTGNVLDDLKRNSEDLKEFNLDVHRYYFNFKDFSHAPIYIAGNWHTMDEAVKFHQDFGQLLAYAKRQKVKED